MRKIWILLLMTSWLFGCKGQTQGSDKYTGEELCKLSHQMFDDDQKYRTMDIARDPFFDILDSICAARGITEEEYLTFSKEKQLEYGRIARKIADKRPKPDQKILDSIGKLQKALDRKNTRLLIDIVKKVGFPREEIMPCDFSPDVVFYHAPEEFWDEIKPLILKEFNEGHIDAASFAMMVRQVNGRKEYDLNKIVERVKITGKIENDSIQIGF